MTSTISEKHQQTRQNTWTWSFSVSFHSWGCECRKRSPYEPDKHDPIWRQQSSWVYFSGLNGYYMNSVIPLTSGTLWPEQKSSFWPLFCFPTAGQNIHWSADTRGRNCKFWMFTLFPAVTCSSQSFTLTVSYICSRWLMWSSIGTLLGRTTSLSPLPPRWLIEKPAPCRPHPWPKVTDAPVLPSYTIPV